MTLIGIAQFAQYVVACRIADVHPGQMRSLFKGATGHSQGVVSAIAIASSDSWESLETNIAKAVKHLFYLGLRGQEGFPLLSLEPHIVADSIENNEGAPTPMLGVYGLNVKSLQAHIKKVNAHLPSNSQIGISLFNTTTAFVVTGPAKALYGLVTALRKVMAPPGLDQGRIPFSKRKAVFNMRFLPVNVPYHSEYLAGQTEKLVQQDLGGEELWSASDLAIAIYNTEDGTSSLHFTFGYANVRIRLASIHQPNRLAQRSDLHQAHPLGESMQLPFHRHPRRRFRTRRYLWYRTPNRPST
jgi:fatty acid synthase subunit beta